MKVAGRALRAGSARVPVPDHRAPTQRLHSRFLASSKVQSPIRQPARNNLQATNQHGLSTICGPNSWPRAPLQTIRA